MSGKLISINTANAGGVNSGAAVSLSAGTPRTVLQVATTSGTNKTKVKVKMLIVSFNGTNTVQEPTVIKLVRTSTAGTGTSVTLARWNEFTENMLCTGNAAFTSTEPTISEVLLPIDIHPQSGFPIILPLGLEIEISANTYFGVQITSPASVTCHAMLLVEE